jgi:REP element-mobilizing transposase RayT
VSEAVSFSVVGDISSKTQQEDSKDTAKTQQRHSKETAKTQQRHSRGRLCHKRVNQGLAIANAAHHNSVMERSSSSGALTPAAFIAKWSRVTLSERSASQQHFIDLCRLLGQPAPAEHDATGAEYAFEKGVAVTDGASRGAKGGSGYADVWWRGKFGWEYKRKDKYGDLCDAYRQLCQYREALDNPPLLVVSDITRTEIHTNFTGTAKQVHVVLLKDFDKPESLALFRRLFTNPESFRPTVTPEKVTEEVAKSIASLARSLQSRGHEPHAAAHFLMKCMFCLFAEDVNLLPNKLFSRLLTVWHNQPSELAARLTELFDKMRTGGAFGSERIAWFNGGLIGVSYASAVSSVAQPPSAVSCCCPSVSSSVVGENSSKIQQENNKETTKTQPRAAVPQKQPQQQPQKQPQQQQQEQEQLSAYYARPSARESMPRYRRNLPHIQAVGRPVFFTFRTREHFILPESVRSAVLAHCLHDNHVKCYVHTAIVMPDHVHMIMTPMYDPDGAPYGFAEIMAGIKGASSHTVNRLLKRKGHVWQDESFDHILRGDEELSKKCLYVADNPIRKELVTSPDDYPWLWRDWVEGEKQQQQQQQDTAKKQQ